MGSLPRNLGDHYSETHRLLAMAVVAPADPGRNCSAVTSPKKRVSADGVEAGTLRRRAPPLRICNIETITLERKHLTEWTSAGSPFMQGSTIALSRPRSFIKKT